MRVSLFVAAVALAACDGGFDDIEFKGGSGGGGVVVGSDFALWGPSRGRVLELPPRPGHRVA